MKALYFLLPVSLALNVLLAWKVWQPSPGHITDRIEVPSAALPKAPSSLVEAADFPWPSLLPARHGRAGSEDPAYLSATLDQALFLSAGNFPLLDGFHFQIDALGRHRVIFPIPQPANYNSPRRPIYDYQSPPSHPGPPASTHPRDSLPVDRGLYGSPGSLGI